MNQRLCESRKMPPLHPDSGRSIEVSCPENRRTQENVSCPRIQEDSCPPKTLRIIVALLALSSGMWNAAAVEDMLCPPAFAQNDDVRSRNAERERLQRIIESIKDKKSPAREVAPQAPAPEAPSGKLTVEEFNRLLVGRLYQAYPDKRYDRRKRSFSPKDWSQVTTFVRVEQDNVPILGSPALDSERLTIKGIASKGELFALVDHTYILISNFLSRHPDQAGVWYKVETLEREQGWVFAEPYGHKGAPFARCYAIGKEQLVTEAMERARAKGAIAGGRDGKRDGYAIGFAEASKAAQKHSYNETINKLYASGHYKRLPMFTLLAITGGFLIGFGLQYTVVLLIRKCGLPDIDWIILGKHGRRLAFGNLAQRLILNRKLLSIFIAVFIVLSMGCENREKEAENKAYDAHYQLGMQATREAGRIDGNKAGTDKGETAAREAVANGLAWQLYTPLGFGAIVWGAFAGILAQYLILVAVREPVRRFCERKTILNNSPTPENFNKVLDCAGLSACHDLCGALVPAMNRSISFAILETWQILFRGRVKDQLMTEAMLTRLLTDWDTAQQAEIKAIGAQFVVDGKKIISDMEKRLRKQ